ncbi:hypothetical protein JB92DRAFT_2971715 [Gautieria morchelliformis]|nr:hypothetical protein JB92DRAFT_2971715 [Gautieria morchelliformis]
MRLASQPHSEGTSYTKCGHYIQTKWIAKIDCNSRRCVKSDLHPPNCSTCAQCEQVRSPASRPPPALC